MFLHRAFCRMYEGILPANGWDILSPRANFSNGKAAIIGNGAKCMLRV